MVDEQYGMHLYVKRVGDIYDNLKEHHELSVSELIQNVLDKLHLEN
jgi:hypothetical protein